MRVALLLLMLMTASAGADEGGVVTEGLRVVATDATRAPRSDAMIGPTCSYRPGVMARRVMSEGSDYAFVGRLQTSDRTPGDVACPYTIAGQVDTCIVASELVEHLANHGLGGDELSLEGRILDVDGVRYVVLTAYKPSTSEG